MIVLGGSWCYMLALDGSRWLLMRSVGGDFGRLMKMEEDAGGLREIAGDWGRCELSRGDAEEQLTHGDSRSPVATGHSWPFVATHGHSCLLMVAYSNSWPLMVSRGRSWSPMVTHGHSWQLIVTRGHS